MEIKIGESLFLGGQSPYQLSSPLQGLESPAIRMGDGLYAGRDGGFVSGHFYGHRTLVLNGFFIGADCEETNTFRRLLAGLLRIRYRLPILIKVASGDEYYTEGFVSNVKSDIDNLVSGEYQISLVCPDPILYAAEDGHALWLEDDLAINNTTQIPNGGDIEVYPKITIKGVFDGIELINDTTEQTMQIGVTTVNPTDTVVVDMEKHIITLNGTTINEYRTPQSRWWCLIPENNNIIVYADNNNVEVKIEYKEGYVGI